MIMATGAGPLDALDSGGRSCVTYMVFWPKDAKSMEISNETPTSTMLEEKWENRIRRNNHLSTFYTKILLTYSVPLNILSSKNDSIASWKKMSPIRQATQIIKWKLEILLVMKVPYPMIQAAAYDWCPEIMKVFKMADIRSSKVQIQSIWTWMPSSIDWWPGGLLWMYLMQQYFK